MQTLKYALRNVLRSKGRSILIGIIVMIIAFAVCISLCIRQSAVNAKEDALEDMNITAQISPDREKAMSEAKNGGSFDKSEMKKNMGTSLSLKQLKKYAKADSVKSFYYTLSASVDGAGKLEAYSSSDSDSDNQPSFNHGGSSEDQGEFSITGYSSDEAMTSFVEGTCKIKSGKVFSEGTSKMVCIISDELAEYNDLSVGDTIKVKSPSDSSEKYKLKIVGIYENTQSDQQAMGGGQGMGMTDPANQIYTSYNTLHKITSKSDSITGMTSGTYVLGTEEAYESFQKEVEELGLSDKYTVSSEDLTSYERMAEPLESLAKFVGYFLIVVLVVGAIILIVLNIFATRERKYEIGVLAAIGMKKKRVAALFMSEIMIITMVGIAIGGGLGAVTSVPVTNSLLKITSSQTQSDKGGFGRDFNKGGDNMTPPGQSSSSDQASDSDSSSSSDTTADSDSSSSKSAPKAIGNYMMNISNAVNLVVLLKLLLSCLAMAVVSGLVSVIAIMRYEPLDILSGRD